MNFMSEVDGLGTKYSIDTQRDSVTNTSASPLCRKKQTWPPWKQDLLLQFTVIPAWLETKAYSLKNECACCLLFPMGKPCTQSWPEDQGCPSAL